MQRLLPDGLQSVHWSGGIRFLCDRLREPTPVSLTPKGGPVLCEEKLPTTRRTLTQAAESRTQQTLELVERHADRSPAPVGADDWTDFADDDVAVVVRGEHVDEQVDVTAVGVEHREVFDLAVKAFHFVHKILKGL